MLDYSRYIITDEDSEKLTEANTNDEALTLAKDCAEENADGNNEDDVEIVLIYKLVKVVRVKTIASTTTEVVEVK